MNWKRIGEVLESLAAVGADDLKAAIEEQNATGELLGEVLVRRGRVSPQEVVRALATQLGIEEVIAGSFPEEPVCLPDKLSPLFLKHNSIVPLAVADGSLKVAMARPQDPWPAEALRAFTGLSVKRAVATESDVQEAIARLYDGKDLGSIIEGMDVKDAEVSGNEVESLKEAALEAPVINLVNIIIQRAIEKRASDIHIEPFENSLKVRYRVDGILYLSESLPRKLQPVVASRIKLMARLNIAERRLPQDGRIAFGQKGAEVDIRVSTIPTLFGESVVMRLLDQKGVLTMKALGFSGRTMEAFSRLIRQPHGMLLVTGPTGSGKSTTLYAALSAIDSSAKKVVTIEDPVEYNIEGVNQIQTKAQIGFTFANGLRSIVRQDPDVIMVGEIRVAETAGIAIHSALTGHLIFSSLH
ncbi:partial Type II secretion system protein E, partial [Geobacteraceae bacterium]